MKQVWIRLYEELNDHLPAEKKKCTWPLVYEGKMTIAAMLQSIGVPIAEVDLILRNSESVHPSEVIHARDRFSVYPTFESLDIKAAERVRSEPLRRPAFIADHGLERLAFHLRLSGFDVLTRAGLADEHGIEGSERESHILLIRADLPAPDAAHYVRVHSLSPPAQAEEVIARLDLHSLIKPYSRCPRCNELLKDGEVRVCGRCGWRHLRGIGRLRK